MKRRTLAAAAATVPWSSLVNAQEAASDARPGISQVRFGASLNIIGG